MLLHMGLQIPQKESDLIPWTQDLVDECSVSIEDRRNEAGNLRQAFYTGTIDEAYPSKHNKCYALIDTKASYLFSPSDVRFKVEFYGDDTDEWSLKAAKASHRLTRAFNAADVEMAVSQAVEMALVEKSCFIKLSARMKPVAEADGRENFSHFEANIVRQAFMGVLREDITDLDKQDAFVHAYYLTPKQLRRLIWNHPNRDDLVARAMSAGIRRPGDEVAQDSYFYELVLGGAAGGNPPVSTGTPSGARGAIPNLLNPMPAPVLGVKVAGDLIRVNDLWVWNDEQNDWTTIRYIAPDIILEGAKRHRNLSGIPGEHGFVKFCPNETVGYFWGRSELANVLNLQSVINKRANDIDTIFHLQSNPPKAFIGFSGITQEKQLAMMANCAHVFMDEPAGKVEDISPKMPPDYLAYLNLLDNYFDEAAGLNGVLQGRGEPGIRSGVQAGQMMRTSTPRLRDQAFAVEGQVAQLGNLGLKMMQAKDAQVLMAENQSFLLSQLPADANVTVDSHSSSPAFVQDSINLAFALAKAGAMDAVDLLEATHPQNVEHLMRKARAKEQQNALLMQQIQKQDPEGFVDILKHRMGGRR